MKQRIDKWMPLLTGGIFGSNFNAFDLVAFHQCISCNSSNVGFLIWWLLWCCVSIPVKSWYNRKVSNEQKTTG